MSDLSVVLGPLRLRNPVMPASGTYGHGLEMLSFTPPEKLGAWVSKTVTLEPRPGNPTPRICETGAGMINSIGLENRGIEDYLRSVLPGMQGADTLVVTNIGGESIEEYAELARRLEGRAEVDALEVNLSCPNIQAGLLPFSTDPGQAGRVIEAVRAVSSKPLFAKLSPNVTRIADIARGVEAAGADAITAVNTLLGLALDWRTGKPGVAMVQGGLSGPAIKPVALRCAWECARNVSIPVIGCGGIASVDDALEYIVAGCSAIQVGTACFADPCLPGRLVDELEEALAGRGVASIRELIGTIRDGRATQKGEAELEEGADRRLCS